jgi:phenylacetate-CoA ligase
LRLQKLQALLCHVGNHVPYYRHLFHTLKIKPEECTSLDFLRHIPFLTKETIQRESHNLLSEHIPLNKLKPSRTGGSTGKTIYFYLDKTKQATMVASRLRGNTWVGSSPFVKTAYLWALEEEQSFKETIWNWCKAKASKSLWLNLWDLDQNNAEHYVAAINSFKPVHLAGYSSGLCMLSFLMQDKGLAFDVPLKAICSADTLSNRMQEIICTKISQEIYNRYGCREVGLIAMSCEHGTLHLNEDNLIVEILDEKNRPVIPGQAGRVVLTDLHNYSMPFIRYEIEDLAIPEHTLCPCGRTFSSLQSVQGRSAEVLVDVNGDYINYSHPILLLEEFPQIEQFQIHQYQDKSLDIKITLRPGKTWEAQAEKSAREKLSQIMKGDVPISFFHTDTIPLSSSGKHRYVVSDFNVLQ